MNTNRAMYNQRIIELLLQFTKQYPDIRFEQMLEILEKDAPKDTFYEESQVTYERMAKNFRSRAGLDK